MDILDSYISKEPSEQNDLDIFKGEWSSRLPDKFGLRTEPGSARLFEDGRVIWAEEVLGSFENRNILELGPLEGGHSYMFQERNANKVTAIEANTRAYLKCLCIKEILKLHKVEFKLGDFMSYLENHNKRYDMVFASGVLYHMEDPVKLLKLISQASDRLFVWTHYDKSAISGRKELRRKFGPLETLEFEGMHYEYSTQSYKQALDWSGFCGGSKPKSKWLTRDSILNAIREFGYTNIQFNFEHIDHPNGPAFAFCANK
jgi:hypothetical protein